MAIRRGSGKQLARRVWDVGPLGTWLLAKTFGLLLVAKIALRVLPVTRIIGWKQREIELKSAASAEDLLRVRRAVLVVARYSPIRFVCFPQCLAACALLRGQGIDSRLHYGVARSGTSSAKLVTHTWLEAGGEIVIGGEVAGEYSTLAVY